MVVMTSAGSAMEKNSSKHENFQGDTYYTTLEKNKIKKLEEKECFYTFICNL